jgi:hypothetical protein
MQSLSDRTALVEKHSAARDLNLDSDEQEEYGTMLLRLQNQVETGEPSERIVKKRLAYFGRVQGRLSSSSIWNWMTYHGDV